MSRNTSSTSPELIAHPATNMSFGMGFPFPVIHPTMGQFIPMGMVPINSNAIQHYMGLASKSGLHPGMVAPMFGPSAIPPPNMIFQGGGTFGNDSGSISQKGMDQAQIKNPVSSNLIPGHDTRTTSSSNVRSIGENKNPVPQVPPVFFLPYSPGSMAGYFPHYPTFNVMTPPNNAEIQPKDSKPLQNVPEQDPVLPCKSEDGKDSDELDVARILVNMQVPVLKQIQSSKTTPSSQSLTVDKDVNIAKNASIDQKESLKNDILILSAPIDVPSIACKTQQHSDEPVNTAPIFQHCSEQNDKHLEKASSNNFGIDDLEIDRQIIENTEGRNYGSLDPNNQVRPQEMQSEENKIEEDPSDIKLEVISEGESTKPLLTQSMDSIDYERLLVPSDAAVIHTPYSSLEEESSKTSKEKHLQELPCIKSEAMDFSSDPNPVGEPIPSAASKESSKPLSSDITMASFSSEQGNPEHENINTLKQESSEERKQQTDVENDTNCETADELSNEENGLPQKDYKCDVCSQLFRSPLGLQKHIEFHMDDGKHYNCTICFMHFCDDLALQEHLEKHMRKRPHKCKECPKAFRDPGSLQKHVRVHTGEKPYKCKDCPRSFAEYSSLRKHQRVHTGEQPYKCQYCSKAFSISGNLQRHILIHTGERPYKCNFCIKAFNNPSHLRRHVKNLHFRGDAAIDEAMMSHYGNPSATKIAENYSSLEIHEDGTAKAEKQPVIIGTTTTTTGRNSPNAGSIELESRNVEIQAL